MAWNVRMIYILLFASFLSLAKQNEAQDNHLSENLLVVNNNLLYHFDSLTGELTELLDSSNWNSPSAYIRVQDSRTLYANWSGIQQIVLGANSDNVEHVISLFEIDNLYDYRLHPNPNLILIGYVVPTGTAYPSYQYCLFYINTGDCDDLSDTVSDIIYTATIASDIVWINDREFIPLLGILRIVNVETGVIKIIDENLQVYRGSLLEPSGDLLLEGNRLQNQTSDRSTYFYVYDKTNDEITQLNYSLPASAPRDIGASANNETITYYRVTENAEYILLDFNSGEVICELPNSQYIVWLTNRLSFLSVEYLTGEETSTIATQVIQINAINCQVEAGVLLDGRVQVFPLN